MAPRKGSIPWSKGKKFTKEHRDKLSKARMGKEPWNKGMKNGMSDEGKKSMIAKKTGMTSKKKGKPGKKLSKEQIEGLRKRMTGPSNPNWKGGYENKIWHNNQRRIKKLGNGGSHSLAEWETLKAQYNWTCPCCKRMEPEVRLSRDHIIPISKGGSDNIENIQPLCRSCNSRKYNKVIRYE